MTRPEHIIKRVEWVEARMCNSHGWLDVHRESLAQSHQSANLPFCNTSRHGATCTLRIGQENGDYIHQHLKS